MDSPPARFRRSDKFLPDQKRKRVLKRERSLCAGDGDLLMDVLQRVLADVLSRAVSDHKEFSRRNSPPACYEATGSAS